MNPLVRSAYLVAALAVATLPGAGPGAADLGADETPTAGEAAPGPAPNDQVTLDLRVNEAGGAARAGARVRVLARVADGTYRLAAEGLTDVGGAARLDGLPAGEAWVVADAPGAARTGAHVVLAAPARSLDLVLSEARPLAVEVVDEAGQPVEGATVEVRGASPVPSSAATGTAGRVDVPGVAAGAGVVRVRAPSFDEATRRFGAADALVRITLARLGGLVVKVRDAAGAPAAGATVGLASAALFPERVARADAAGVARVSGLPPGAYALRATRGADVSATELGIAVERGVSREVELQLGAGRFVTVAVRGDDAPFEGARVVLVEQGLSPFPLEGATPRDGVVRLGPVPLAGSASVSVRADGRVGRGPLSVPEGPAPRVDVELERAVALRGRVVDARGFPVSGARLRVVGTDREGMPVDDDPGRGAFRDAHFAQALAGAPALVAAGDLGVVPGPVPPVPRGGALTPTGASSPGAAPRGGADPEPWLSARDGTFEIPGLPPGRLRVVAQHPLWVDAESDTVDVAPDARGRVRSEVTIVMREGGVLLGRVVDPRGRGVEGADVTVLATRGDLERRVVAASDGTFELAALPGEVTVLVARPEDPSRPVLRAQVEVAERGRRAVTLELPEARGAARVVVRDERGDAVDGAEVHVESLVASDPLRTTLFTGRRGDVEVPEARGLAVTIGVSAPGRAPRTVTVAKLGPEHVVALVRGERLVGRVRSRRDVVSGATVTWESELGPRRARTGLDGGFAFDELAPGDGRLVVRARGFAPLERVARVVGGAARALDVGALELEAEGVAEGVVVDARGEPVPGARVAAGRVGTFALAGAVDDRAVTTDRRGAFRLGELGGGAVTLEAYAPGAGRGQAEGVAVAPGRTTPGVRIVLAAEGAGPGEPRGQASLAVTLGEGGEPLEVSLADVAPGSEAERAGLRAGDVVLDVSGTPATSIEATRRALTGPLADDVVLRFRRGDVVRSVRVRREAVRR